MSTYITKFIEENDGYFPVKIKSLPEGSVIYPRVPVFTITAEGEYAKLLTYLEGLLDMVWYPTTVATLSRRVKDVITASFEKSVPKEDHHLILGYVMEGGRGFIPQMQNLRLDWCDGWFCATAMLSFVLIWCLNFCQSFSLFFIIP